MKNVSEGMKEQLVNALNEGVTEASATADVSEISEVLADEIVMLLSQTEVENTKQELAMDFFLAVLREIHGKENVGSPPEMAELTHQVSRAVIDYSLDTLNDRSRLFSHLVSAMLIELQKLVYAQLPVDKNKPHFRVAYVR